MPPTWGVPGLYWSALDILAVGNYRSHLWPHPLAAQRIATTGLTRACCRAAVLRFHFMRLSVTRNRGNEFCKVRSASQYNLVPSPELMAKSYKNVAPTTMDLSKHRRVSRAVGVQTWLKHGIQHPFGLSPSRLQHPVSLKKQADSVLAVLRRSLGREPHAQSQSPARA